MPEAAERQRSFIAIPLSQGVQLQVAGLQQRLSQAAPELKLSKLENLHLTLHFLGDQPQDQLAKIASSMLSIGQKKKYFNATVAGLAFFPNQRRPNILWLGIQPQNGLIDLHHHLAAELRKLGIEPDPHPFRPHLTIGRFKRPPKQTTGLCPFLSHSCGSFKIKELTLFSSRLTAGGAIHTPLQTVALLGTED